jgi:hypothetical protein
MEVMEHLAVMEERGALPRGFVVDSRVMPPGTTITVEMRCGCVWWMHNIWPRTRVDHESSHLLTLSAVGHFDRFVAEEQVTPSTIEAVAAVCCMLAIKWCATGSFKQGGSLTDLVAVVLR